jgi:hypothetical protein
VKKLGYSLLGLAVYFVPSAASWAQSAFLQSACLESSPCNFLLLLFFLRGTLPKASKVFLADLTKAYLVQTSFLVQIEPVGGLDPAKRIQAGEVFDLLRLALSKRALAAAGDVDLRRCQ